MAQGAAKPALGQAAHRCEKPWIGWRKRPRRRGSAALYLLDICHILGGHPLGFIPAPRWGWRCTRKRRSGRVPHSSRCDGWRHNIRMPTPGTGGCRGPIIATPSLAIAMNGPRDLLLPIDEKLRRSFW